MLALHALYSKMLAERTASRNVLVIYIFYYIYFETVFLSGKSKPRYCHTKRYNKGVFRQ